MKATISLWITSAMLFCTLGTLALDAATWGINESDMLMNNYVDHTVTVSGDRVHPTAAERNDAQHFLRAYDVVVQSSTCQK